MRTDEAVTPPTWLQQTWRWGYNDIGPWWFFTNGFDLQLMFSVSNVSDIPPAGENLVIVALVIVANVRDVLYFRIFDGDGKKVVDTDENELTAQAQQIKDLKRRLDSLRPPHDPTSSEKECVIAAVTSIVGHTLKTKACPDSVASSMKEAGADALVVRIQDQDGPSWKTACEGQPDYLKDRDLVAELSAACRERKMRFVGYILALEDWPIWDKYPDWRMLNSEHVPYGWFLCCNSPYRDLVRNRLVELARNYPDLHGAFFDMFFWYRGACYCQYCTERFKAQNNGQDPPTNEDFDGFDLLLMPSLNDVSGIQASGMNLVIVAAVNNVLHFRIFDANGKVVVDTDETRLTTQAGPIADLKRQLDSVRPPHQLTGSEKDRVIAEVTSIVDNPLWRSWQEFQHRIIEDSLRDWRQAVREVRTDFVIIANTWNGWIFHEENGGSSVRVADNLDGTLEEEGWYWGAGRRVILRLPPAVAVHELVPAKHGRQCRRAGPLRCPHVGSGQRSPGVRRPAADHRGRRSRGRHDLLRRSSVAILPPRLPGNEAGLRLHQSP